MATKTLAFDTTTYAKRRQSLMKSMGKGKILLLGNDTVGMNYKDNYYPFRQDSTFLYYIGIDQPGLMAIIDADRGRTYLFGLDLTIDDIIWTGKVPSLHELAEASGIERVKSRVDVIKYIDADVHYLPPYRDDHIVLLSKLTGRKNRKVTKRVSNKLIRAVSKQREVKSSEELEQMDIASKLSHQMHLDVMKAARAGMKECDLVSIAAQAAWSNNVSFSYPPILTINGQVLHNHEYGNELHDGSMVLYDGGCEAPSHYAGDITRTFPIAKEFTIQQKSIYDIVHAAYDKAVELSQPGTNNIDVHIGAAQVIATGLKNLGIMKGDIEEAVEAGAHTMFFPHGLGHMIGLDVHDMENLGEDNIGYSKSVKRRQEFGFRSLRLGKALKEGFCITIEPGIYFIPDLIDMRRKEKMHKDFINYKELEKWKDLGGIRLEDDYVISADGANKLGIDIPTSSDEIEAYRAEALS